MSLADTTPEYKKICLTDHDGGLQSVLTLCNVHRSIQELIVEEGFMNLREFIMGFQARHWEKQVEEFHDKTADQDIKGKRVSQARLKSAWSLGREALEARKKASAGEPGSNIEDPRDWEQPLAAQDQQAMVEDFEKRYALIIEPHLHPCDSLQQRLWREFRRWTPSVTEVGKMRSLLMDRAGKSTESHSILPNVEVTYSAVPDFNPRSIIEYYWGLRVLMYAWARAGNYMVESKEKPGTKVLMIDLTAALNYADRALRVTTMAGLPFTEQLPWMERKDGLTGGVMAAHMRQQTPAGEALKLALSETSSDWATVKGHEVVGVHESFVAHEAPDHRPITGPGQSNRGGGGKADKGKGGKGKGKEGKGKAGGNGVKSKIGNLASKNKSGSKICGSFNSKKGCKSDEAKCPQWALHCCGMIISEDGKVCHNRDHGFTDHHRH